MFRGPSLSGCPHILNRHISKSGWAAAATTEEFSQGIQAPSSMHPAISYPVRANPSLRCSVCHRYLGLVLSLASGDVTAAVRIVLGKIGLRDYIVNIYIYIYIYNCVAMHVCIHIYIYRERGREREREIQIHTCVYVYISHPSEPTSDFRNSIPFACNDIIYIYIYIYIYMHHI